MIIIIIALIVTAPVVTLIVVAVNACHRSARAALPGPPTQQGLLRVAAAGSAIVGLVLADVAWIVYSLHWAQIPLLANLACGAGAVGALLLLREQESRR